MALVLTYLLGISTCSPHPPLLDWIRLQGVLRVATTNSPTTCYQGSSAPRGFQCELLQEFADHLGVQLQLVYVRNQPAATRALLDGHAQLAVGITRGTTGGDPLRFSPPLQHVTQRLVYSSAPRPANMGTLKGQIEVVADSAAENALVGASVLYPKLDWKSSRSLGSEDLLYRVAQGTLPYTVASSDLTTLNQRFYPNLIASLRLTKPQAVVWAVRRAEDISLYTAMQTFFSQVGPAKLAQLRHVYFTRKSPLAYLDITQFTADYDAILPKYRKTFITAARKSKIDWRLMAAIGYQESHWNPNAVSPTGVRGLMMLTAATAQFVNVADREKPKQAIRGGTRYFAQILRSIPSSVPQPDRTWMALAAWNMGLGHLRDARDITRQRGGDPDRWSDVQRALPLLTQEKWFTKTRYGYGQGNQALAFVANVRSYYDILVWLTAGQSKLISSP